MLDARPEKKVKRRMKHIDTLAKYEEYLAVGMNAAEARTHVKAWVETLDLSREDLATKADFGLLKADLDLVGLRLESKINQVELRLESKIDKLGNTVYVMGGAIFTVCCIPILQKML